ncbi:hypothetical protein [Sphingomonas sp. ERG5]|uniref:hypothetical protein n=1 Tax=Sphingomonas sp. ERG5 TaxID=1381597 RepID=UPI000A690BAB|nr:hypothetical protein [Sphingomonas sp. ERG5]
MPASDALSFLLAWVLAPLRVASVAPSSTRLATVYRVATIKTLSADDWRFA